MRIAHLKVWVLLAVLVAGGFPSAWADIDMAEEPGSGSAQSIPVDEELKDQIAGIDKLAARRAWREAIDACQKLISTRPKGMVEIRPGVYGSAGALCEKKIEGFPDSAKLLYRTVYDPAAEKLYRRAADERDIDAARRTVLEFAQTSYGLDALNLLGRLLFEKGDAWGALDAWRRWMDRAQADALPEAERRLMAVKIAVAAAMADDGPALERAVQLFGPKGTVVEAGGLKLAQADELRRFAAQYRRSTEEVPPALPAPCDFKRWETGVTSRYATYMTRSYGEGAGIGYSCDVALAKGMLYVNTPDGPQALEALTGRTVWKRGVRNYDADYYQAVRSQNFYCRILAAPAAGKAVFFSSGGSRLDAYDADTGAPIWSKSRTSLAGIEAVGNDPNLRVAFSSPVLSSGRNAYVIMETTRSEVFLLALDRADGAVRWCVPVGWGGPQQGGYRVSFPSDLVMVGTDIVFCNGHGLIGRCDAASGEMKWLVPYQRLRALQEAHARPSVVLAYSPLVRVGEDVVTMPSDGEELIAVSVSDGSTRWKKSIPGRGTPSDGRDGQEGWRREPRFLGASRAGDMVRLFVLGDGQVQCLSAAKGSVLWTWPVPDAARCSGQVTDAGVIVAANSGLYFLSADAGELEWFQPLALRGSGAAAVACDKDALAVSVPNSVTVVAGIGRTRELLGPAAAGPWASAVWSRVLRAEGKYEEAITRVNEAISLAKKSSTDRQLIESLEAERVKAYQDLFASEWKAGRTMEAFRWMRTGLQADGKTPYECKVGGRRESGRDSLEPHTVVLASGDRLSGKLTGIDWGIVTFVVKGEPWQIAAQGVRSVILGKGVRVAEGDRAAGPSVLLSNGDRISCRVESLRDGVLTVSAAFAQFSLKLSEVSVIVLGGAERPAGRAVYVRLRNGDQVSGELAAFDGSDLVLDIPFCGRHRVPVSRVYAVSNRRMVPASAAPSPRDRPDVDGEGEEGGDVQAVPPEVIDNEQ